MKDLIWAGQVALPLEHRSSSCLLHVAVAKQVVLVSVSSTPSEFSKRPPFSQIKFPVEL